MGFNSAFKGLICRSKLAASVLELCRTTEISYEQYGVDMYKTGYLDENRCTRLHGNRRDFL